MNQSLLFPLIAFLASTPPVQDSPSPPTVTPATSLPFKAINHPKLATVEMYVTVSETDKGKGLLVHLPETLSVANAGKPTEINFGIWNTLEESLLIEVEPEESVGFDYESPNRWAMGGGGGSIGPHGRRYELAAGSDYSSGTRVMSCCSVVSRKARVTLPAGAKPGAKFAVTLRVRGYFLKNGQPFSGEVTAPIKLVE